MRNIKLNLIKVNKCLGINFYSGSIRLEDLFESYQVPVYKPGAGDIQSKTVDIKENQSK